MLDLVKDLFESYGFICKEANNGLLFMPKDLNAKKSFWLVVSVKDLNSIVDQQSEMLTACKTVCHDSAMEKNISLLILWETDGNLDHIILSQKVMSVEEDSYFFKKYVLYFSAQERDALHSAIGSESFPDFIKEHIESKETFAIYKKDPHTQSWYSLLYRTVMKLPFVRLTMDFTDGLESLSMRNHQAVVTANIDNLADFDRDFFLLMKDRTAVDIKADDKADGAEKLFAELLPLLGGSSNGN